MTTPWVSDEERTEARFTGDELRDRVNGARAARQPIELTAIPGDLSSIKRTRWAWREWLPLGCFTLIAGEGGQGKGILSCYVLAGLSRGTIPGDLEGEPVNTLWVGFEDGWDEVVLPRLHAAGADVSRVHRLYVETPGRYLDIVRDLDAFAKVTTDHQIRAICFEAIVDHLIGVDDHKNADVRRALTPLVELARRQQMLVLGTSHLNKMSTGTYRQRVAGSGGYLAVARVGLLVHPHPDDDQLRVLALGKGNLGRIPDSLVFSIEGFDVPNPVDPEEVANVGCLVDPYFDGSLTVEEVLTGPRSEHRSRESEVVAFLEELLLDGPRKSVDVYAAAKKHGLGEKALQRHKDAAGVHVGQRDRAWWWRIGAPDE